jgi:hypothetical protein
VASNDDHGLFGTSRVRFQTIKGANYEIAVDGFRQGPDVASGNITLNLVFMRDPILRPANDLFTNRVFLAGSSGNVDGSNTNATREPAEPLHAEGFGDASVWWSWTAPASGLVVVSTEGSTFDTLLGIYSGTTLASLTIVTNSDDIDPANELFTSQAIFQAVAGRSYQIAVDGFDGAMGWIHLHIGPLLLRLGLPTLLSDGRFEFTVTGPPGLTNGIELSTDLRSWIPLDTLVNELGTVTFVDSPGTLSGNRFYRATVGP